MDQILRDIAGHARRDPQKLAVADSSRALTYSEFDRLTGAFAQILVEAGANPGDPIAYFGPNDSCHVVAFYACQKAGLNHIPIPPSFPSEMVDRILKATSARITIQYQKDRAGHPPAINIIPPELSDLSENTKILSPIKCDDFLQAGTACTSGSTGIPKLVPVTRKSLEEYTPYSVEIMGIKDDEIYGHMANLWFETFSIPLTAGSSIRSLGRPHAPISEVQDWIQDHKITMLMSYPAYFRTLFDGAAKWDSLRWVILAGEGLDHSDLARFDHATPKGAVFFNAYAQQEFMCGAHNFYVSGDPIPKGDFAAGIPWDKGGMHIVDADRKELPPGSVGEIAYYSDLLAPEYIGAPEQTAAVFVDGPDGPRGKRYFYTGDTGYLDAEGHLHCIGRTDDQLKVLGFNVRPSQIEREILSLPQVKEAVVVSEKCDRNIARLVCYFAGDIDDKGIRAHLSKSMATFMIPQFFVKLDALPRTHSGKVKRTGFAFADHISEAGIVHPQTEIEGEIHEIWTRILGNSKFGIHDNFYEIGGDSLRCLEMLLEIERTFEANVTMDAFALDGATISTLLPHVKNPKGSRIRLLKPGLPEKTAYCIHRERGGVNAYLELAGASSKDIHLLGVCGEFESRAKKLLSIKDHAKAAAALLPDEEYRVIIGHSFAGPIAWEIAQLTPQTKTDLVLLDPYIPGFRSRARGTMNNVLGRVSNRPRMLDVNYRPTKPNGSNNVNRVVLFTTKWFEGHKLSVWQKTIGPAIEIRKSAGQHNDQLKNANAIELAKFLDEWL